MAAKRAPKDLLPEADPVIVEEPPPPDPPGQLPRAARRLIHRLLAQCAKDQVLHQTVEPFLAAPDWKDVDDGVETENWPRYLRLSGDEITIGHVEFSGTTRIPLLRNR